MFLFLIVALCTQSQVFERSAVYISIIRTPIWPWSQAEARPLALSLIGLGFKQPPAHAPRPRACSSAVSSAELAELGPSRPAPARGAIGWIFSRFSRKNKNKKDFLKILGRISIIFDDFYRPGPLQTFPGLSKPSRTSPNLLIFIEFRELSGFDLKD